MCVWGLIDVCMQCCTHMTSVCRIQKAESPGASSRASSSCGAQRTACHLRSAASDFTLTAIWLAFFLIRATGPLRHGFACAVIPKKWGMHGSRMGGADSSSRLVPQSESLREWPSKRLTATQLRVRDGAGLMRSSIAPLQQNRQWGCLAWMKTTFNRVSMQSNCTYLLLTYLTLLIGCLVSV